MGRPCSVCALSADVARINLELERGSSCAALAKEFGVSDDAMLRHRKHLVRASETPALAQPIYETDKWLQRLESMFSDAVKAGNVPMQLRAAQQAMRALRDRAEQAARTVGSRGNGGDGSGISIELLDSIMRAHEKRCTEQKLCLHCGQPLPLVKAKGANDGNSNNHCDA
jgi:hypothetical protein